MEEPLRAAVRRRRAEERLVSAAALALGRLCAEHGDAAPPPPGDPYSRASVDPGCRGAARAPVKRKVLRRRPDGALEVCDESARGEPQLWSVRRRWSDSLSEGDAESECTGGSSFLEGSSTDVCPRRRAPRSLPAQPKSFIPPRLEQPGRGQPKTDRVAKYWEYRRDWASFGVPGEQAHRELRWGVREQLLEAASEAPSRARGPRPPNAYVVPTEKKRAALRWHVRCLLAGGLLPRRSASS
ncbi:centriolar and ciliogenesis-associated protein HYLS1 [Eudromia elegans]